MFYVSNFMKRKANVVKTKRLTFIFLNKKITEQKKWSGSERVVH